jgi:hypothetical protein
LNATVSNEESLVISLVFRLESICLCNRNASATFLVRERAYLA